MFCKNCGNQLSDGSAFCEKCGNPVNSSAQQTQAPQQPPIASQASAAEVTVTIPSWTKWLKLLISLALIATTIISGVLYTMVNTGRTHIVDHEIVDDAIYKLYPKMETLDMIFGYIWFILVVFSILALFALIGRAKMAPTLVTSILSASGIATAIYGFMADGMVHDLIPVSYDGIITLGICNLIGAAAAVVVSKLYFNKCGSLYTKK